MWQTWQGGVAALSDNTALVVCLIVLLCSEDGGAPCQPWVHSAAPATYLPRLGRSTRPVPAELVFLFKSFLFLKLQSNHASALKAMLLAWPGYYVPDGEGGYCNRGRLNGCPCSSAVTRHDAPALWAAPGLAAGQFLAVECLVVNRLTLRNFSAPASLQARSAADAWSLLLQAPVLRSLRCTGRRRPTGIGRQSFTPLVARQLPLEPGLVAVLNPAP